MWWEIVNNKHPEKGFHLRVKEAVPFTSVDDERFNFLKNFCRVDYFMGKLKGKAQAWWIIPRNVF